MLNVLVALGLLVTLCGMGLYALRQSRKDGRTEEKLKASEKVTGNVKKAKDALVRLNDDIRDKLRDRYRK